MLNATEQQYAIFLISVGVVFLSDIFSAKCLLTPFSINRYAQYNNTLLSIIHKCRMIHNHHNFGRFGTPNL